MKYQKPKVVAKSTPKQSFSAGCPTNKPHDNFCSSLNTRCLCGLLK